MPSSQLPLPPLDEILADAHVVALPLVARFRGITVREALLMRGPHGWSEFSPFLEYGATEASSWLAAAIDFGWSQPPTPLRRVIPVNATVPALDAAQVAETLERYPGARTAKVKVAEVGQSMADDVARVREVRRVLGPEGRIRVDANGLWNVDEAETALRALAEFDLEYAEQPCASVAELAELRARLRNLDLPIAADESVRKAEDPLAVARAGAADILVVKVQPLGGVHAAQRIAVDAGLPVVVSSAIDTSVGLAMGAFLAAALPDLPFDCGLGTAAMLTADVAADPLVPHDGVIDVRRPEVSTELLDRYAAPEPRREWWLTRLTACYEILSARDLR